MARLGLMLFPRRSKTIRMTTMSPTIRKPPRSYSSPRWKGLSKTSIRMIRMVPILIGDSLKIDCPRPQPLYAPSIYCPFGGAWFVRGQAQCALPTDGERSRPALTGSNALHGIRLCLAELARR